MHAGHLNGIHRLGLVLTLRFLFVQTTKKIDVTKYYVKALFVADIYSNFSRVSHFSSLLCEEGVLPLLIHIMDTHPSDDIMRKCTEALANLSLNRKNRREIASCGIASRLTMIFELGSPSTRSHVLLIMGNLLSSGLFHDKVANEQTISNILDNMLDINYPRQFTAVAYCICQLSKVESSCEVMVNCAVIPIVLGYLRQAPQDAVDYLWTVLVNISQHIIFSYDLIKEINALINELYEETRDDSSRIHQQMSVAQISVNMSIRQEMSDSMTEEYIEKFVKCMKVLFASRSGTPKIQLTALITLTNFAFHCRQARAHILGNDLLELFHQVGMHDDKMNVQFIGLLNIISNEDLCCYKLLELGVQKLLVTLQDSFSKLVLGGSQSSIEKKKPKAFKGAAQNINSLLSAAGLNDTATVGQESNATSPNSEARKAALHEADEFDAFSQGELGKSLSAAILHNISLKRPVLAPGLLMTILALAKNTKTLRVLHCVRALTNMSVHSKSKIALGKEAKRIIPLLTVIMRCGCEEAEKVQHYSAIATCNILAMSLEKDLLQYLAKSGAIVDLIVVTLLRTNVITTKESLGKAFFNLLAVGDIRELLIVNIDILAAVLELSKIEYMQLLELCIRTLYNVTCELRAGSGRDESYSNKLIALKVPRFLVSKLMYSPNAPGPVSNQSIRMLLGMSIANMSFNKNLVMEFTNEGDKMADAMYRVFAIHTDESVYCAVVCLFNISTIPECKVLSNSKAIPLLVEVLQRKSSILCMKLAVATLCNFSMLATFFDQLTTLAIPSVVRVIASPQLHMSVKKDAVQIIYNLVTQHTPSRQTVIENDGVIALWKLLKVQGTNNATAEEVGDTTIVSDADASELGDTEPDEDSTLTVIGHVVKELCSDISDYKVEKKIMTDGIMNIILKLSKIEIPALKLDMAYSLHSMSNAVDLMKVLKWDSIDIAFWLLMHDTLNLHDLIMKNVTRALRCFSFSPDVAKTLVKQERFFSVIKALIKSKNEDVLWQTAGALYNLMQIEQCLKLLLKGGLVSFIFEIASSGYESVKHVCSACLHMVPENMPNMEDPLVLELVLALLEAQGDKFSELSIKPTKPLPYTSLKSFLSSSTMKHTWTGFTSEWTTLTCQVDNLFSPANLMAPSEFTLNLTLPVIESSTISGSEAHDKILSAHYNNFIHRTESQDNVYANSYVKTKIDELQESDTVPPAPSLPSDNGASLPSKLRTETKTAAAHENDDAMSVMSDDKDNFSDMQDNASIGSAAKSVKQVVEDMRRGSKSVSIVRNSADSIKPKAPVLPLIQPPRSLPDDTVGAITDSIARSKQKNSGSDKTRLDLSGKTKGTRNKPVKGLSNSFLSASHGSLSAISINNHGNDDR